VPLATGRGLADPPGGRSHAGARRPAKDPRDPARSRTTQRERQSGTGAV